MKILSIRALRGPSIYHNQPCIIMRLDIEELEERPSNTIDGFRARLEAKLPSPSPWGGRSARRMSE